MSYDHTLATIYPLITPLTPLVVVVPPLVITPSIHQHLVIKIMIIIILHFKTHLTPLPGGRS